MLRRGWFALALLGAIGGCSQEAEQSTPSSGNAPNTPIVQTMPTKPAAIPQGSGFDFYVLALSWSPSYCEAEGQDANRQQCSAGRPYAFVVHGLWPQYERGFPADCQTDERDVDDRTVRSLYDLMPSAGLIRHQWRKHGSCSGLDQDDYFKVLRAAREAIAIPARYRHPTGYLTIDPDDVEADFIKANPSLRAASVAVTCDNRYLREVRICMGKDLKFRSCPEIDRRGCRRSDVVMPPVRGG